MGIARTTAVQVFEKRLELEELEDKEFEKDLLLNFKEVVSKVQSL